MQQSMKYDIHQIFERVIKVVFGAILFVLIFAMAVGTVKMLYNVYTILLDPYDGAGGDPGIPDHPYAFMQTGIERLAQGVHLFNIVFAKKFSQKAPVHFDPLQDIPAILFVRSMQQGEVKAIGNG